MGHHPFLVLGFAKYPECPLISLSFFSCCFFCCYDFASACFPSSPSTERKLPAISFFFGKTRLAAFHIKLKVSGWQHFHSSLASPHMELQAHLKPCPPTMTGCKPSTKKI